MRHTPAVEVVRPFRVALWLALTLPFAFPTAGRAAAEGVNCPAEPVDMNIAYGQLINCTIESGDSDIFRFSGIARENVVLLVLKTPTSSLRPCLELVGPDNSRTTSCANAFSQRIDKTLNLTGTYTILVSASSFSGPYTLALERVALPSSTAMPIQYGQTLSDEINPEGDLDLFYLGGGVGDSIVLTVTKTPTSSLRPCLELIAPDNSRTTSCVNAFSQRIDKTLNLTGTYTILVSASSFSGAYTLTLQCVSASCSANTTLFVPIILSSAGLNNSFFSSEIVFTNRGSRDTVMDFNYVAAFGGGSGTASAPLPAGRQSIVADAIAHLRSLGMPIPGSGNRGGTLVVRFSGLSSASDAAVTVRTTTIVPEGRAGLAYSGLSAQSLLTGPAYLCGLRQNAADRSNVAVQNAGTGYDGSIVLRLTVFSGGS
ncbi:MAG: hypothetical protein L0312_27690, partial [Acidobacteria bacterium]|nr:hypothetical protein [Acidobacteriota bacterium]